MINFNENHKTKPGPFPTLRRFLFYDYVDRSTTEPVMNLIENSDINVLSCKYWRGDEPWHVTRRQINDNFLIYAVSGSLKVVLDDREKCLDPGEFMLIEDDYPHGYMTPAGGAFSEHIIIHCFAFAPDGRNLISLFKEKLFKVQHVDYWTQRLKELCCLSEWKNDLFKQRSVSLFKTLLQELLLNGAELSDFNSSGDPRINKALQIIEHEFDQDLSVEGLAQRCGLQPVRFRQLFKQQTRQSPRQYLIYYRLKQAKHFLIRTDYSIQEIAEMTGFCHDYYFCSTFKRVQRQTPMQYRQNPYA